MKENTARDQAIERAVAAKLRADLQIPAPGCAEAETLAAYVERRLTAAERANWESHFAACARCQEQVAALVRLAESEQPAEAVTARGAGFVPFRWAWAASALVVVLIAGVWYTGDFTSLLRQPPSTPVRAPVAARPSVTPQTQNAPARLNPPLKNKQAEPFNQEQQLAGLTRLKKREEAKASITGPQPTPGPPATLLPGAPSGTPSAQVAVQSSSARPEAIRTPSERAQLEAPAPGEGGGVARGIASTSEKQAGSGAANAAASTPSPAPAPALQREQPAVRRAAIQSKAANQEAASAPDAFRALSLTPVEGREVGLGSRWRVGKGGLIERLDSQGHWAQVSSGVKTDLYALNFPNAQTGWIVGQGGVVLRTTDGGATWVKVSSPTSEDLVRIIATSDQAAVVKTRSDRVFVTADGGQSWNERHPD